MYKSNEQNETDVRILANFLKKRLIDEKAGICTYAEMATVLGGRNVQNGSRWILSLARKDVEKSFNVIIGTVNSEGVNLVNDLTGVMDKTLRHIGRTSRRTERRVINAVSDTMPNAEKISLYARVAALGSLAIFTKPKSMLKIEAKMIETQKTELPTAETLRLFEK